MSLMYLKGMFALASLISNPLCHIDGNALEMSKNIANVLFLMIVILIYFAYWLILVCFSREAASAILDCEQWKSALRNCTVEGNKVTTPMRKLIKKLQILPNFYVEQ